MQLWPTKYKIALGKGALKSYICINFDRKGTEIVHLWFPKYTFFYEKKVGCPLQPSENLDHKGPEIMR